MIKNGNLKSHIALTMVDILFIYVSFAGRTMTENNENHQSINRSFG